jgi:hypothetical protein
MLARKGEANSVNRVKYLEDVKQDFGWQAQEKSRYQWPRSQEL